MESLNEIAEKCDAAISSKNKEDIEFLINELQDALAINTVEEKEGCAHYILGNLHLQLSSILTEEAAGWRNDNYPHNLTSAINHLRCAETLESGVAMEVKTNLANAIAMQRRNIEVLDYWQYDFTIQGDSPFVSSMGKARELIWISHWLNDPSYANIYKYEAYLILENLQKNISKTNHSGVINSLNTDEELRHYLDNGAEFFAPLQGWQNEHKKSIYSGDEKKYRAWCLQNRLFANHLNGITTEWIADQDTLNFPNHEVGINDGPYFSAAFSSLKREFCFARFMAYEGIHELHPTYENEKLFLTNTLDYVHYSGSIEKMKTAFRVCFSVFDSIVFLINAYFKCDAKQVSFSSRWIKEHFKDKGENHFIDALYWLACDLTDNPNITNSPDKWRAPNPHAAEIRKIRNAIEHGWLRVAEQEQRVWDKSSDFAYIVTPDDLQKHTLFVLKLARAAMIYLCMAVSYNEMKNKKTEGLTVKLPITLVDDDLISF